MSGMALTRLKNSPRGWPSTVTSATDPTGRSSVSNQGRRLSALSSLVGGTAVLGANSCGGYGGTSCTVQQRWSEYTMGYLLMTCKCQPCEVAGMERPQYCRNLCVVQSSDRQINPADWLHAVMHPAVSLLGLRFGPRVATELLADGWSAVWNMPVWPAADPPGTSAAGIASRSDVQPQPCDLHPLQCARTPALR